MSELFISCELDADARVVALVGAVSNVSNLCKTYSWLAWLCDAPRSVIGLIQGVFPALLLAILMKLLPVVLRQLSKFEGVPRRTGLELSLMTRYFMFLVTVRTDTLRLTTPQSTHLFTVSSILF